MKKPLCPHPREQHGSEVGGGRDPALQEEENLNSAQWETGGGGTRRLNDVSKAPANSRKLAVKACG